MSVFPATSVLDYMSDRLSRLFRPPGSSPRRPDTRPRPPLPFDERPLLGSSMVAGASDPRLKAGPSQPLHPPLHLSSTQQDASTSFSAGPLVTFGANQPGFSSHDVVAPSVPSVPSCSPHASPLRPCSGAFRPPSGAAQHAQQEHEHPSSTSMASHTIINRDLNSPATAHMQQSTRARPRGAPDLSLPSRPASRT